MKRALLILAVLLLIGGCLGSEPPLDTPSPTTSTTKITIAPRINQPENGDNVSIDYTVTWNGEVYDTTREEKALSSPHSELIQSMHPKGFEPLTFTVDTGSKDPARKIFSSTVKNMIPGDKIKIYRSAELFGWTHNKELVQTQARSFTVPVEESMPMDRFHALFEKTPAIGMQVSWYKHWNSTVTDINNEIVRITHAPINGSTFTGLGGTIQVKSSGKHITTTFNPILGKTYLSPEGRYITYTDAKPDTVTADYNHPLAGKTVEIEIILNNITRQ